MVIKELPEELITVILSKLPVKSLLRFKCVCKTWYFLIKSPNFINLHIMNSNHNCFIIRHCTLKDPNILNPYVLSFYSHETLVDLGIEIITPFNHGLDFVSVSGPCNGLICITNNHNKIFLCNPATREFRSLFVPPSFGYRSGYHIETVAFGFDPNSSKYKAVMIGVHFKCHWFDDSVPIEEDENYGSPDYFPGDREAAVYDFSTDSWRETGIIFPDPFYYSHRSITLNGAFHWWPIMTHIFSILTFLISDEVFESIPLPEFYSWDHETRNMELFVLNKSLALIVYSRNEYFEISVMNEYGLKDSWAKLVQLGPLPGIHYPLAFWKLNDEDMILLEAGFTDLEIDVHSHLVSCDFQHQNVEHFPIRGLSSSVFTEIRDSASFNVLLYSESLVSVNSIGKSA